MRDSFCLLIGTANVPTIVKEQGNSPERIQGVEEPKMRDIESYKIREPERERESLRRTENHNTLDYSVGDFMDSKIQVVAEPNLVNSKVSRSRGFKTRESEGLGGMRR